MSKKTLQIKTKLSNDSAPGASHSHLDSEKADVISPSISKKLFLKNFRLRGLDIQRLQGIVKAVNEVSTTNITETDVIKSLIYLGSKSKKSKIINAYRESL